jgi:hypothetical protein
VRPGLTSIHEGELAEDPVPEKVLLGHLQPLDVRALVVGDAQVDLGGPLVPRGDHGHVAAVPVRPRGDARVGEEAVLVEESLRLGEEERVEAVALLEEELPLDERFLRVDVQSVRERVGEPDHLVGRAVRVEDRATGDLDRRDAARNARVIFRGPGSFLRRRPDVPVLRRRRGSPRQKRERNRQAHGKDSRLHAQEGAPSARRSAKGVGMRQGILGWHGSSRVAMAALHWIPFSAL